jgi:hypothetical protein
MDQSDHFNEDVFVFGDQILEQKFADTFEVAIYAMVIDYEKCHVFCSDLSSCRLSVADHC